MKHSLDTQGSDVYDKKVQERLNHAAFQWCETYTGRFESENFREAESDDGADENPCEERDPDMV